MEISLDTLRDGFAQMGYVIKEEALSVVYLALKLEKPLLVCGAAGVGKTELAKALSGILKARLIRLQCHEGLDESKAIYDWNIQRQLVRIHLAGKNRREDTEDLFSLPYILQRPLLQAITQEGQVLLLIDEIDRADRSFEALLLEILSDFQVSIPEIGTIKAAHRPVVVITSNGERELSEAIRRRCVFLYLDYPDIKEEAAILRLRASEVIDALDENIALAVAQAREQGYRLGTGSSAALDWARAVFILNADRYQKDYVAGTLDALARNKENIVAHEAFLQGGGFIGHLAGKRSESRELREYHEGGGNDNSGS